MSRNAVSKFRRSKPAKQGYDFTRIKKPQCIVCGEIPLYSASRIIWNEDCIRIGKMLYVIPEEHPNCRELFLLNPLAYE